MIEASYYHCRVIPISRATGRSAVAAAAYRAAARIMDERTGVEHDYGRKSGVVHSEVMLPSGAPDQLRDRAVLWNEAERTETRKNARTAREMRLALPSSLTDEQRLALCREIGALLVARYGVAVDLSIHRADASGDARNEHAHIMFTTRRITQDGFAEKTRVLDDRALGKVEIGHLRVAMAELMNRSLARAGIEERVDARSYRDRGIELEPTVHLGPFATLLERMGGRSELGDHNRLVEEDNAERHLERITATRSVFSEGDIAGYFFRRGEDPERRAEVLADPRVIRLHDPDSGAALDLYTTKGIRTREREVMALAASRAEDAGSDVSEKARASARRGRTLDDEQDAALAHAVAPGGLKIIQGRAGTGKSYTMGAIRDAYAVDGRQVIGLAPTNTVTEDLRRDGFRHARTVHSLLWQLEQKRLRDRPTDVRLDGRTVLMVDEAAMLDTETLGRFLKEADRVGCKVILVGDERQLSSVARGGLFEIMAQAHGSVDLTQVRRQRGWQKDASEAFAAGRFEDGIRAYDERGYVTWSDDMRGSATALLQKWHDDTRAALGKSFVFAYTNRDVDVLNSALHGAEVRRGRVRDAVEIDTHKGPLLVGAGSRVQFRETDKRLGLANGSLGTVSRAEPQRLDVTLDNGRRVEVPLDRYTAVELGYAGTIYRGQGKTLDRSYVLHTHHWRDKASYVAMTRAREATQVFVSRDHARDIEDLAVKMARSSDAGASLRYLDADEARTRQQERQKMARRREEADRKAQEARERVEQEKAEREQEEQVRESRLHASLDELAELRRKGFEELEREAARQREEDRRREDEDRDRPALPDQDFAGIGPAGAPYDARTRYHASVQAIGRADPTDYSRRADISLHNAKAFAREHNELQKDIAEETDPKHREALELRRDIEALDHLQQSWDECYRIQVELADMTGRGLSADGIRFRDNAHRLQRERDDKLSAWQERSRIDPDRYPPLGDVRERELAARGRSTLERSPVDEARARLAARIRRQDRATTEDRSRDDDVQAARQRLKDRVAGRQSDRSQNRDKPEMAHREQGKEKDRERSGRDDDDYER